MKLSSQCTIMVRDQKTAKVLGQCLIDLRTLKVTECSSDMIDLMPKLGSESLGPCLRLTYRLTKSKQPGVILEGELEKQGGALGGRANWTTRWFVLLPDKLEYYENKDVFHQKGSPKGVILLNSYYCTESKLENEFEIHAVPKPLKCRAKNRSQLDLWIRTLNMPTKSVMELLKH